MLDQVNPDIYKNDELKHFGILGMHWGIRRYQNPDGTLTPEGRERYLKTGVDGKQELTEEGYKQFFNRDKQYSPNEKTKRNAAALIAEAALIGGGAVAGNFLAPGGAAGGAVAGAAIATLIPIAGIIYESNPDSFKGLTNEGGKFFYDEKTGMLTDEAKEMIFDETTFLTDLGRTWINEQFDERVHGDVPESPEYKVIELDKARKAEINKYVNEHIWPMCKNMPVSVYLEKQWNSDNPSEEYKVFEKYAKEVNRKYYNIIMNEISKNKPLPKGIVSTITSQNNKKSSSNKRSQSIQRVKSLKNSGKTLEEISETTGIPLGTVKEYLYN